MFRFMCCFITVETCSASHNPLSLYTLLNGRRYKYKLKTFNFKNYIKAEFEHLNG